MRKSFVVLFISALLGCATPGAISIHDLNVSLVELQKIVQEALPVARRRQSTNGREHFSEYFAIKGGDFEAAPEAPLRHHAHILILGDRKPYTIDVVVLTEKRQSDGRYELVKRDQGIARVISRRIQNALHKRRDGLNIIDDFRVF